MRVCFPQSFILRTVSSQRADSIVVSVFPNELYQVRQFRTLERNLRTIYLIEVFFIEQPVNLVNDQNHAIWNIALLNYRQFQRKFFLYPFVIKHFSYRIKDLLVYLCLEDVFAKSIRWRVNDLTANSEDLVERTICLFISQRQLHRQAATVDFISFQA